jgi:hypothetical protein
MKSKVTPPVLAAIASISGVVVLLGYFLDYPSLRDLRNMFVDWAVILAAVALLVGVLNLARVHWKRVKTSQKGSLDSLVLIISFLVTLVIVIVFGGPTAPWSMWIYNNILIPVETSLLALLAVILIYTFARMFARGITAPMLIFAGVVLFTLVGAVSLPGLEIPLLSELRDWVTQVWALAGLRGILIGVALGTIATGLRILLGSDRPYSG